MNLLRVLLAHHVLLVEAAIVQAVRVVEEVLGLVFLERATQQTAGQLGLGSSSKGAAHLIIFITATVAEAGGAVPHDVEVEGGNPGGERAPECADWQKGAWRASEGDKQSAKKISKVASRESDRNQEAGPSRGQLARSVHRESNARGKMSNSNPQNDGRFNLEGANCPRRGCRIRRLPSSLSGVARQIFEAHPCPSAAPSNSCGDSDHLAKNGPGAVHEPHARHEASGTRSCMRKLSVLLLNSNSEQSTAWASNDPTEQD